jgi:hypothetical protein
LAYSSALKTKPCVPLEGTVIFIKLYSVKPQTTEYFIGTAEKTTYSEVQMQKKTMDKDEGHCLHW